MPVREPPEDAPAETVDLLNAIVSEVDHEHCLFFIDTAFSGPGTPSTIWMYYPDRRERPDLAPGGKALLATITEIVENQHPSTFSHVSGMEEHDYPDDVPEGASELTKISPKGV